MCNEHATPTITPDMTIADLLRHYPHLGEPLACLVPSYRALSTPAVREVISKTMTVHQLATNGGIAPGSLITKLRAAAGVEETQPADAEPRWIAEATSMVCLDARPVLATGAHPVNDVMAGLAALGSGEVFELVTPFVPTPLVDMARARGFEAFSAREGETVHTYFRSNSAGR
jgi:hypothetical protein